MTQLAPDGKTEVIFGGFVQSVEDPDLWIFWNGGEEFFYAVREEVTLPARKTHQYRFIGAEPHEDKGNPPK